MYLATEQVNFYFHQDVADNPLRINGRILTAENQEMENLTSIGDIKSVVFCSVVGTIKMSCQN